MRRSWLLACAVLAGCASYQPKPIAPARLARSFDQRSLASDGLRTYLGQQLGHDVRPWPPQRWDRELLTLAADYYSPALVLARAQWTSAKAGIDVAAAIPNPMLLLPFQYATNGPGPGLPYTTGPTLDIPIETAHKRAYRIDRASQLSEAARLNIGDEAWKLRSQVRGAMLGVYSARERATMLVRKLAAQQQIVEMVAKRSAVGEAAEPDVDRAVLASTQAQIDLAATQRASQDALARLAAAIGVPIAALESVRIDLADFEYTGAPPPPAVARREAILHRADLLGSLANYEAAQAALQLEIAKQYPDIHLGPGYTYDMGTNKIGFGLAGITLPVFDRNQGGIAQAEARRAEAAARVAALQDTIINALDHALAHYRASLHALRLASKNLSTARRRLDSEATRFAEGTTDRLSLAQAKADCAMIEIEHLNAVVGTQQAAGLLEDAMQRPLRPVPAVAAVPAVSSVSAVSAVPAVTQ